MHEAFVRLETDTGRAEPHSPLPVKQSDHWQSYAVTLQVIQNISGRHFVNCGNFSLSVEAFKNLPLSFIIGKTFKQESNFKLRGNSSL